uniref:Secreted protein n=1 Tax=Syphacia muris TaxID=451379 RepID=A0A0N5AJJ2_9BILA
MVCVPCLILPFIQPYVLRLLPQSWQAKLDQILYPTCPIRSQRTETNTAEPPSNNSETTATSNKKID